MKISELELFTMVAQEQSFVKASKRLHFSQSAVSQHIKKMETELGFSLFDRNRHSVSLTPQGTILYDAARDILSRYQQAIEACQKEGSKVKELLLSYVGSSSCSFLHALIREYQAAHPAVGIATRRIRPDRVAEALEKGEAHLLFTPYDLVTPYPQIHFQPLYADGLSVVMNEANPLSKKDQLSYRDLNGKSILAPSPSFCPKNLVPVLDRLREEKRHCKILNGYNIDNVQMQLLSHVEYFAIMPGHAVPENAGICAIPFDSEVKIQVGLAYLRSLDPEEADLVSLALTLPPG